MKYSNEVQKRLVNINKLREQALEKNWLEDWLESAFSKEMQADIQSAIKKLETKKTEIDGEFELLYTLMQQNQNRKFLIPLFHLISSNDETSNLFMESLNHWFIHKHMLIKSRITPKEIVGILNILKKDKSKQGKESLESFKKFVLDSGALRNHSNFYQMLDEPVITRGPGVSLQSKYFESFSTDFAKNVFNAILHSFGLIFDNSNQIPSYEDVSALEKFGLIYPLNKKLFDEVVKDYLHVNTLDGFAKTWQQDYEAIKAFNWLPNASDLPSFHVDYLQLNRWSYKNSKKINIKRHIAYLLSINYLLNILRARSRIYGSLADDQIPEITLEELALISDTKNIRTIRNEITKKNSILEYGSSKNAIPRMHVDVWCVENKRKKPIYHFLDKQEDLLKEFSLKDLEKL